ncbi:MAG: FeoA family protein [Wenzhouxiangellaceae bacterium]|nr:FeoA family protein [Wenzhouxiangellaceae bacterium]
MRSVEPQPSEQELPLWQLALGCRAIVTGFSEALSPAYRTRMSEMGFHPGETVSCVLRPALGAPRMYRVSNTVFSLDRDIAGAIRVRPE